MSLVGVCFEGKHKACERINPFGAHRIPFVRHRARSDLFFFERLFYFTKRLQHADITRELRRTRRDTRQHTQHLCVKLARVGLAAHRDRRTEPHCCRDATVEFAHFAMVTLEQREEAGLRARGALDAAQRQIRDAIVEIGEIDHQILHPQRRPLTYRGELRRLQVRVPKRRFGAPLAGERGEPAEHGVQPRLQQLEAAANLN